MNIFLLRTNLIFCQSEIFHMMVTDKRYGLSVNLIATKGIIHILRNQSSLRVLGEWLGGQKTPIYYKFGTFYVHAYIRGSRKVL